jgi:hypothetical protein
MMMREVCFSSASVIEKCMNEKYLLKTEKQKHFSAEQKGKQTQSIEKEREGEKEKEK